MRGADEREREAKVSEMLSMINLEGYEDEYPHECSGDSNSESPSLEHSPSIPTSC